MNRLNNFLFFLIYIMFQFPTIDALADCPGCYNLVPVEIKLKNLQTISGFAYENSSYEGHLDFIKQENFLFIESYYTENDTKIDLKLWREHELESFVFYDVKKARLINKNDITSFKITGRKDSKLGEPVSLSGQFVDTLLNIKPYYQRFVVNFLLISFDKNYDKEAFKICEDLCGVSGDCKEVFICEKSYNCFFDLKNLSDKFLVLYPREE